MDQDVDLALEDGGLSFALPCINFENVDKLLSFSGPQFIYKAKEIIIVVTKD